MEQWTVFSDQCPTELFAELVLKYAAQNHKEDTAADSGQFGGHQAPMPDLPERPVAEKKANAPATTRILDSTCARSFIGVWVGFPS